MNPPRSTDDIFRRYMDTGFGDIHPCTPEEYEAYARYYARNWNPILPPPPGAAILDLGCGAGHFLYYLRKRGYANSRGVDLSRQCVDVCLRQALNAEQADAFEFLQNQRAAFDAIVANDLMEHLTREDCFRLAALCRQALRDRAPLVIKVPNAACPVGGARARYCDVTHETAFTAHSLRTLLVASGFSDVSFVAPDIYATSNPVANLGGKVLFAVATAVFRLLYYLYGIRRSGPLTKDLIAVARAVPTAGGDAPAS